MVGSNLTITNSGSITGGISGDTTGAVQADAIDFIGGANRLDLSTGTLSGNVGVDGTTTSLNFVQGAAATLADAITGAGSVIDSGAGTLTLSAANTYSGATTISAGTLQLGNGGTTGSIADTSGITDNATLTVDRSDVFTLGTVISGTGALNQIGTGTLALTNPNTYTGGTALSAGTLELAAQGAAGSTQAGSQTAGGVAFGSTSATLRIDGAAFTETGAAGFYTAPVTNFAAGDILDLSDLAYTTGTSVTGTGGSLEVANTNGTRTLTDFTLAGGAVPTGDVLTATRDATGGTEVTIAAVPTVTGSGASTTDNEAPVTPFTGATVTDNNAGATDTVSIALTGAGGTFAEPAIAGGTLSGGGTSYMLTAGAGTITAALQALQFTPTVGTAGSANVTDFSLTDTSSAGTASTTDSAFSVTDFDSPGRPPAPTLAAASDSGVSNSDDVTDVTLPTFTGVAGAVLPGAIVTLYDGQAQIGTAMAQADGSYSVTATTALTQGANSITVTQTTSGLASAMSPATSVTLDTVAPTVTAVADSGPGISANGSGDLDAGKTVTLTVTTSEAVYVQGGTPILTLNDGGTATYAGGSGTNQITFSYTVAAGQNTSALSVASVNADGATVTDAAGNPTSTSLAGATLPSGTLIIDTTPPTASSPTLTVAQNAGATPIGIAAPSDNLTPAGSLAIVAGALPTDGTVTLATAPRR